jgi:hypothetical protein
MILMVVGPDQYAYAKRCGELRQPQDEEEFPEQTTGLHHVTRPESSWRRLRMLWG